MRQLLVEQEMYKNKQGDFSSQYYWPRKKHNDTMDQASLRPETQFRNMVAFAVPTLGTFSQHQTGQMCSQSSSERVQGVQFHRR